MKMNPALVNDCLYFCDGNSLVAGVGPFRSYRSKPDEPSFYVNDFSLRVAEPWLVPMSVIEPDFCDFESFEMPVIRWQSPDQETFKMVFRRVRREVLRGALLKMVPVLTQSGRLLSGDPAAFFGKLHPMQPGLLAYGGVRNGCGFAGVTPELLLRHEGGKLMSMALAGTASPMRLESFSSDVKEILEQALVADWLGERLGKLGEVVRDERAMLEAGGLRHLVSHFCVSDPLGKVDEWIDLLHPTPAVGCLPRSLGGRDWLNQYRLQLGAPPEFAAPFGYNDGLGKVTVLIRIRGVFWQGDQYRIPSGCGVVRGSVFDHEWRELAMKRQSTRMALGL